MADEKSGKSSESMKKTTSSNEVNIDRMSIVEDSAIVIKGIDANRYATKKTVAQGLLDIALLTSNASQLKYILQVGSKHEFYTLLVTLITISIILQVIAGIIGLVISSLNADNYKQKKIANWLYHISVGLMTGVIFCDVIKMNFGLDPALSEHDFFGNNSVLNTMLGKN